MTTTDDRCLRWGQGSVGSARESLGRWMAQALFAAAGLRLTGGRRWQLASSSREHGPMTEAHVIKLGHGPGRS
jgi:hypothetical protein